MAHGNPTQIAFIVRFGGYITSDYLNKSEAILTNVNTSLSAKMIHGIHSDVGPVIPVGKVCFFTLIPLQ